MNVSVDKDGKRRSTCVIVAAFITTQPRLKLYDILEKLNERVLYFDLNSRLLLELKWK